MPSVTLGGIKCTYDVPGSVLSPLMPPEQNPDTVKARILDSVAAGEKARKAG